MTMRALFEVAAPAKLNLFLHVLGRRDDGYHLLQSVLVLIDWQDTLHFERRDDGHLRRHDLGHALPADDLCLRAARVLQQASGTPHGVDIHIDKQVPWGAGLGGGSSDAASTLLALNRLWALNWPRHRLLALGTTLGADVPFFVGGDNALVEGIGERLTPLALPRRRYAVLKPPQAIATADIFGSEALSRGGEAVILSGSFAGAGRGPKPMADDIGRNDLQPVAEAICPQVIEAAGHLRSRFGNSRMSGSGSAVFARVDEGGEEFGVEDASTPAWPAQTLPAGWVGRLCRGLDHHPLKGWAD